VIDNTAVKDVSNISGIYFDRARSRKLILHVLQQ
jgi:hypothetical protein